MLVALNLRPAVTSVGPLLDQVRDSLAVSTTWAGLLTALPVVCFASGGLTAPILARRFGTGPSIALGIGLITGGLIVRALAGPTLVIVGTVLSALGIAIIQVLVPALVKERFADRIGMMSGGYTAALQGGAALGFALTPPLATWLMGWRPAWASWTVLAAITLVAWIVVLRNGTGASQRAAGLRAEPPRSLLRVGLAWLITAFFGLQALVAFVMMGWLPQLLLAAGVDRTAAGLMAGLLSALAVPISLIVPALAVRRGMSAWIGGLTLCSLAGVLGMIIAPTAAPLLWTILIGIGLSVFSLAITTFGVRATTSRDAAALSGMAQGFGYVFAGTGPFLFGLLHDLTEGWTIPLGLVAVVLVLQLITGILAGRDRQV